MAKFSIFCLVFIIVAVSSLTTCSAARGLPPSMPSDKVKSSQTTTDISTSKLNDATPAADVDTTTKTESDADDWEELAEEEVGSCMGEVDIGSAGGSEESANETDVERPCRRMLPDYGSPSPNKNKKGP